MIETMRIDYLDYPIGFQKTYVVAGSCDNCGKRFNVVLPKGRSRPLNRQDCPSCGCRTVSLTTKAWT